MKVVKIINTGEIRSYLRSTEELQDEQGNKYIPGLSADREIVSEVLTGDGLENFLDKEIRPRRDRMLKESDTIWIEKSSKGEDTSSINTYKQELRDFPNDLDLSNIDYVDEIVWPSL